MDTEMTSPPNKGELIYPFLGKGWSFPPTFNKIHQDLDMTAGALDISNSLILLLGTLPGERKMQPDYGVDLSPILFETLTMGLKTSMKDTIERAVLRFEPRILLDDVHFHLEPWEGILYITLYYTIQTTNSRTNLVFPYYLIEGTDL
jgi:uncharacterized protein